MATTETVSASIDTIRSCTIEITNMCANYYSLVNPKFYTISGHCCDPPQPTISSNNTRVCAFTKTPHTACGIAGILTYDLSYKGIETKSRIAILFSVPYDNNIYENILGVGLFEDTHLCNKSLYDHMYKGKDFSHFTRAKAVESGITYISTIFVLRATMSNDCKAIIKVEFHNR